MTDSLPTHEAGPASSAGDRRGTVSEEQRTYVLGQPEGRSRPISLHSAPQGSWRKTEVLSLSQVFS